MLRATLEAMLATPAHQVTTRRELRDGDADAIVELHRRVYCLEYERNDQFLAAVAVSVDQAIALGWPGAGGGAWLVEHGHRVAGSLGLTDEGEGVGQVRWFVLDGALRGRGLGRSLLAELLSTAGRYGLSKLQLDTFSALQAAAHLYREAGFRLVSARDRDDWGSPITYQRYELTLM